MVIDTNAGAIGKNRLNVPSQSAGGNAINAPQDNTQQPAKNAAPSDSVSLSGRAQAMGRLENQIAQEPAVNSAKVAELKQSISEGSYTVNADTIADKMLSDF